jgi:RNA polymerase sigma factor (sigma-70 family)
MNNRRAGLPLHGLSALFGVGVVAGMSDEQLLERFSADSEVQRQIAFEAIVRRHGRMVFGVCRRILGNDHDAEDAFQATFMVLALKAGMVRKGRSLGPWLHSVAARIARRARLSNTRREQEPIPAAGLVEREGRDPALADLEQVLDLELSRLPDKYRLPLVLCYLQGRTQEEAAQELGWTKGTVSGRLARAKGLLQQRLIRRGFAPSVGLIGVSLAAETASAAIPQTLVASTVRAATLASYGGVTTGFVSVGVMSFVRHSLKVMLLRRVAKIATLVVLCGIGATVIAMPVLVPNHPARRLNPDAGATASYREPASVRIAPWHHPARVVGVAFSASENAVLTAQTDGLVRFWDPATGRQEGTVDVTASRAGVHKSIRQFAISPDGRYLGAAGFVRDNESSQVESTVWIWDMQRRELLRTIDAGQVDLQCMAFSPDGATIATGALREARLWDIASGQGLETAELTPNQTVFSLTFAPDGKVLATVEQGAGIKLWDLDRNEQSLISCALIGGNTVYFSPDGRYIAFNTFDEVAASWDHFVIWDRILRRTQLEAPGTPQGFAPEGRSLAVIKGDKAGRIGNLWLVRTDTGDRLWSAELGRATQQAGVSFAPDRKTIFLAWDNVLRSFDAGTGREKLFAKAPDDGTIVNRLTRP